MKVSPYVLNRMWNLKVEQVQAKLVELQTLFKYLGLEEISITNNPDELTKIEDIIAELFVQIVGRTKAM